MFLEDPEYCLNEEHSRELVEEYSLTYHYQNAIEFLPNFEYNDINANNSDCDDYIEYSDQENSLNFALNSSVSPRNQIFVPRRNIKSNLKNNNDDDNDNENSNNDNNNKYNNNNDDHNKNNDDNNNNDNDINIYDNNHNSDPKKEIQSKIIKDKKNSFMPVKSAIFILRNNKLISEKVFLEMRRCEKILKERCNLRRKFRNSLEIVNLIGIRVNISETKILSEIEVIMESHDFHMIIFCIFDSFSIV